MSKIRVDVLETRDGTKTVNVADLGTATASNVANTPAGNIAATTVQAAINELDSEKVGKTGAQSMTGALTTGGLLSNSGGIGYGVGAGGTVTQATSKLTEVTLNKPTGLITMHAAPLAAGAVATFVINNTRVVDIDTVAASFFGSIPAVLSKYSIRVSTENGAAVVALKNETAGTLAEAVQFTFHIHKGTIS